jgi:hypothetical protein
MAILLLDQVSQEHLDHSFTSKQKTGCLVVHHPVHVIKHGGYDGAQEVVRNGGTIEQESQPPALIREHLLGLTVAFSSLIHTN